MCGFAPGDEVIAVGAPDGYCPERPRLDWPFDPKAIYVVEEVISFGQETGLIVAGLYSPHWTKAWHSICFRKVQRRDLTTWLATENTINEPIRRRESEPA